MRKSVNGESDEIIRPMIQKAFEMRMRARMLLMEADELVDDSERILKSVIAKYKKRSR